MRGERAVECVESELVDEEERGIRGGFFVRCFGGGAGMREMWGMHI